MQIFYKWSKIKPLGCSKFNISGTKKKGGSSPFQRGAVFSSRKGVDIGVMFFTEWQNNSAKTLWVDKKFC